MTRLSTALLALCLLLGIACQRNSITPKEFKQWVENPENGLLASKDIGKCIVQLQYAPAEYLALRELYRTGTVSDSLFSAECEKKRSMLTFIWKISHKYDSGNILYSDLFRGIDYQELVHYFSFGIEKDIKLHNGDKTIPVILHHFERSYGLSPHVTMITAFDATGIDLSQNIQIVLEGQAVNLGIVKITFSSDDLQKIPHVVLDR